MMLSLGELIIHRLPLIKHIYSASKQVSSSLLASRGQQCKAGWIHRG